MTKSDCRKTIQLGSELCIAAISWKSGITVNTRQDDELTHGAQSVVKCMEFYNPPQLEGIQGNTAREYT